MTEPVWYEVMTAALVFCRVGTCLLLLPGLSYGRIPFRFRIWLAIALSSSIAPAVVEKFPGLEVSMQPQQVIPILFAEVAVGTFLGLIAKVVVSAVSTAGAALGNFLGLIGGHSNLHEDQEATTAIGDLLILTATVQIVSGDIYGELLGGLAKTYEFLPLGGLAWNTVVSAMQTLAATISATFLLALVLVAPFLVLAVFINATLGLANRMIPQLPVQFIGGPLLVCSGLLLTEQGLNAFNETFVSTISQWLSRL